LAPGSTAQLYPLRPRKMGTFQWVPHFQPREKREMGD
jgi:hypothetical protein